MQGFRGYLFIWFGQFISLIGSAMTRFAITIWAYQETESALVLATVGFFSFGGSVIFSPIAGAMVDRWNRKTVMMASDLGAGLSTVFLLLMYSTGNLQIWHLYLAGLVNGIFDSFQFPAFSAATTLMIHKKHYTRAHALQSVSESASVIAAPIIAGIVLAWVGIGGVFWFDVVTFLFAVGSVWLTYIPQPVRTEAGDDSRGSLWYEIVYGFKYIWKRPSLMGMQMMFFFINLTGTAAAILLSPMVLATTNNDSVVLGVVQGALGVGGLVGAIVLSAWGGFKRRVHGVFLGMALSGLFGQVLLGLGREVVVWTIGAFLMMFFVPLLNASNQAIWQSKVPPELQGRVFSVRRLIAQITAPFAMLMAGVLADNVFEPGMMPGGSLAPIFGGLVGTGPGAGMSLIILFTGLLGTVGGLMGYLIPFVREIEVLLPDHDQGESELPVAGDVSDLDVEGVPAPVIS